MLPLIIPYSFGATEESSGSFTSVIPAAGSAVVSATTPSVSYTYYPAKILTSDNRYILLTSPARITPSYTSGYRGIVYNANSRTIAFSSPNRTISELLSTARFVSYNSKSREINLNVSTRF
jgi:hypothetical protein